MSQEHAPSFGANPLFDRIVRATQDQPAAQAVADSVQPVVRRALGASAPLKDFLHGVWVGHPLHPVATDVPIGAWTMAAIFDAMALAGQHRYQSAADVCVNVGIAGGAFAAMSGLADWGDTSGRPARVGVVHAVTNSIALTCYVASAIARKRSRTLGVLASFAGFGFAVLGAGIGGHLVYGEQQGVNHAAVDDLPMQWTRLLPFAELIEDRPHKADLDGNAIVLVRQGGEIFALLDRCAHLGGPLSQGAVEGCSISCPWHGSTFSLRNGAVEHGPATLNQPTFETRINEGYVEVRAFEKQAP